MASPNGWLAGIDWARPAATWFDKSMLAYAGPTQPSSQVPPNMMLARDERVAPTDRADETLDAYAQRQCDILKTSLPDCAVLRQAPLKVGAFDAQEVLFQWQAGAHRLAQWVVWVGMPDQSVLSFTGTCDAVQFDQHRPMFEASLKALQIQPQQFPPRVAR